MPSSVGRTLAIDDSCWYRWILILGRMGSRLLSRLIIILQFRTEFHHLPQTQLIRVVRATYPNVEPQPPPAQDRLPPSAHRTSRDARPCAARCLPTQGGQAHRGCCASGTTPPWLQPVEGEPTPGGVPAAPAQELGSKATPDRAGPTTMHSWWQIELNTTNDAQPIILILPVVPHKAVAEVSKIGNL